MHIPLTPRACREQGLKYTLDAIAPMYEKYFQDVYNVYTGNGWYTLRDEEEKVKKEEPKAKAKVAIPPKKVTKISEPEKPTLELKPKPKRPQENTGCRNSHNRHSSPYQLTKLLMIASLSERPSLVSSRPSP